MSRVPKKPNPSRLIAIGPSARDTVNLAEFQRAALLRRIILRKVFAAIRRMKLAEELTDQPHHRRSHAAT